LQSLANDDLHAVARRDVLLALAHGGFVVVLGEVALDRERLGGRDRGHGHHRLQAGLQLAQARLGAGVGAGLAGVGIDDEEEAVSEVVDDGELFTLQQQDVGRADAGGLRTLGQARLDQAHGVVAEVAVKAATKTRQALGHGDLEALLVGGDEIERIALEGFNHLAIGDDFNLMVGGAHQGAGGQADKGVAPETLAAHDGFKQKAQGLALGELEVERQRGVEVSQGLGHQGDAVMALGRQSEEVLFGQHGCDLGEVPGAARAWQLGARNRQTGRDTCGSPVRGKVPIQAGEAQPRQGQAPRSCGPLVCLREMNIDPV